ncbi:MAG: aminopeptidase [Oscillospiraceae bacterium]|nr:aminopeptidase [Oscillospiraceae bacterium]
MTESEYKDLRKQLLLDSKNGYDQLSDANRAELESYCKDYLRFVNEAKTEREAVDWVVDAARKAGFREYDPTAALTPGDKLYCVNRGKSVSLAVIGKKPLEDGTRIAAAHIDSPRLDLKPNPLYEEAEMAFFKTHYYGGIKKYQWTAIPLSIHGVLALTDGSTLKVSIGEDPGDPVFCVTDLLIHLAQEQMKKTLAEGVSGENLNILVGSRPLAVDSKEKDRVKLAVLLLLHEKYGITEEDFLSAELCLVPAMPAREVGFDRSMIGAYGHDDRVCAYACLAPLLALDAPEHTAFCLLADKEEIGSEGVTGMQSEAFEYLMQQLCASTGADLRRCLSNSVCLSADVTAALDPAYDSVFDKHNCARMNYGVSLCKYTGSRGKSGASDASAEVVARFRRAFSRSGVCWQMGELGKVDAGGGGTVAKYMAKRNIDTLDAGVPVLSMHAPWEIVGKLDCYMTMKAYRAFYGMD